MKRPPIAWSAWLLILALLLAPLAPVRAGWACPDGSTCVPDGRSFRCEKDAAPQVALPSCCVRKVETRCHHAEYPGMAAPAAQPIVQAPDHCRFTISARPELPAALSTAASFQLLAPDGLIPAALTLPAPPVAVTAYPCVAATRYGPPLLRRTGPSRAPPSA
jgi:hypothetical protein